jgi:hypothetical protein
MAVSNSVDFTLSANEVVETALGMLGVFAEEEPMEAFELNRGLRTLNMMLKAWQADMPMTWTMTEGTLTLVDGQEAYDFGAGGDFTTLPFDVIDVRINRGGNDLPMCQMSRIEYQDLPNKATKGYPTQWFYDRQRDSAKLYVWPAPDATAGTLKFTYRRVVMDMDGAANNLDLPQEWTEAVALNLARRLLVYYGGSGTPRGQTIIGEAELAYGKLASFDTGRGDGSITIRPTSYGDR